MKAARRRLRENAAKKKAAQHIEHQADLKRLPAEPAVPALPLPPTSKETVAPASAPPPPPPSPAPTKRRPRRRREHISDFLKQAQLSDRYSAALEEALEMTGHLHAPDDDDITVAVEQHSTGSSGGGGGSSSSSSSQKPDHRQHSALVASKKGHGLTHLPAWMLPHVFAEGGDSCDRDMKTFCHFLHDHVDELAGGMDSDGDDDGDDGGGGVGGGGGDAVRTTTSPH